MSDLKYIRDTYNVPAYRDVRVKIGSMFGIITGANGPYISVQMEGYKHSNNYHPLDGITYITENSGNDLQKRPRTGAAAIIMRHDEYGTRILVAQRCKDPYRGYWVIPGGGIMPDETMRNAVKREIKEETNLDIFVIRQFGAYEYIADIHIIVIFFFAQIIGESVMTPGDDSGALLWVTRDELKHLDVTPLNLRVWDDLAKEGCLRPSFRPFSLP